MNLDQWGFTHWFDRVPSEEQAHLPTDLNSFGRITGVHRKRIDVQTAAGFETVDFQVANKALQIAVGDWVGLDTQPDKQLTITRVYFRTSLLSRIASGPRKTLQPLASNVDHVFILAAMDRTFNVARMERFLAAAWASGIEPVLVLTKADLVDTAEPYEDAIRAVALDTPSSQSTRTMRVPSNCCGLSWAKLHKHHDRFVRGREIHLDQHPGRRFRHEHPAGKGI